VEKRISIEEIFDHPWMTKYLQPKPLKLDFKAMKNFSNFSKVVIFLSSSKL